MAKKKSNKNAMKKIDKQLDKLLKEKKDIEDIPVIDRKEIEKKKNTKSKKEAIVVPSRKNKNNKKDAIVVKERKDTKKKSSKKRVLSNKNVKVEEKVKVSEATMRLQKLEKEIRTLYDKVEDVVEDIESDKTVDIIPGKDIIITDACVSSSNDDTSLDRESIIWNCIVVSLLVIFMILFIAFVGFVIYVCTY